MKMKRYNHLLVSIFLLLSPAVFAWTTCPTPGQPSLTSPDGTCESTDSITFEWDAASNATGYIVQVKSNTDSSYHTIATVANNSYLWNNAALPGKTYQWRVKSINACGTGYITSYSLYSSAKSFNTRPGLAINPQPEDYATGVPSTQILQWAVASGGATSYDVYLGIDEQAVATATTSDTTGIYRESVPVNYYDPPDSDLVPGETYYWRVDEVRNGCVGSTGTVWEFTVQSVPTGPNAPSGLTATAISTSQILLRWTDNSGDETAFKIQRKTGGGSYDYFDTVAANQTSYIDEGLTSDSIYTYQVCATKDGDDSAWSDPATQSPKPFATTLTSITVDDGSLLDITWIASSEADVTSYNLYRTTSPNQTYTKISDVTSPYDDTSLNNGTTYYYYVTVVDNQGNESAASNLESATPRDETAPANPTGLNVEGNDNTETITLSWTDGGAESDSVGFNIYRSTVSSDGPYVQTASRVDSTSYDDSLVSTDGTIYYYKVSESDTSGNESGFAGPVSADVTPPRVPINIAAASTGSAINVNWTPGLPSPDPDLLGYNVYRDVNNSGTSVKIANQIAATTYQDTAVQLNETYQYQVTSVDASFESAKSVEVTADITKPATPTGLAATAGSGYIHLTWAANTESDLAGYNIQRSEVDESNYTLIASTANIEYIDSGLANGTKYYYKISAKDTSGNESPLSGPENATPQGGSLTVVITPEEDVMSPELVSNGDFTDSQLGNDWSNPGTGWTVVDEKAVYVDEDSAGVIQTLVPPAIEIGRTYKLSATVTNSTITGKTVSLSLPGIGIIQFSEGGEYELVAEATQTGSLLTIDASLINIGDTFTIDDVSVIEVPQWSIVGESGGPYNSGETVSGLEIDAVKTIHFSDLSSGWTTPSDVSVPIVNGLSTVNAEYIDDDPPTPDPATFEIAPQKFDATSVEMMATTGTDLLSPPVEYCFTRLGPELVTNGGFDAADGWFLSNGWSIDGNVASFLLGSTYEQISRYIPITLGKTYLVSIDFEITQGTFQVVFWDENWENVTETGTFTKIVTPLEEYSQLMVWNISGVTGDSCTIDNVSVREVYDTSDWQANRGYIDTGLTQGQTYTYTVKMRDSAGNETQVMQDSTASVALGTSRWYVSLSGDNSDGLSWATAFNHLQDALDVATSGQEIWVAAGTYYPDQSTVNPNGSGDISAAYNLKSGVAIYGGFSGDGTENILEERNLELNPTILSGDIDNETDYCLDFGGINNTSNEHVVINDNTLFDMQDFSISFWVKGGDMEYDTDIDRYQTLLSNWDGNTGQSSEWYSFEWDNSSEELLFKVSDGTAITTVSTVNINVDIFDGQWHHIVGVRDEDIELRIYVDGTSLDSESETPSLIEPTHALWMGGQDNQDQYLSGRIDDVIIFARTLTSTEISNTLYQNKMDGLHPLKDLTNKPLFYWDFNEGDGTTTTDMMQNEVATLTGSGAAPHWAITGLDQDYRNSSHVVIASGVSIDSTAILDGFTISGGWAKGGTIDGGGVFCDNASPILRNCIITQNISNRYGGGICNINNASPVLINCLIVGNWARDGGGGIYNDASHADLVNCTITENADGGILCNNTSTIAVQNSILWKNRKEATDPLNEIELVDAGSSVDITYSHVQGGSGGINGSGTINWGDGNDQIDPLFESPGSWQWRLLDGRGDFDDNPSNPTTFEYDTSSIVFYDFQVAHSDFQKGGAGTHTPEYEDDGFVYADSQHQSVDLEYLTGDIYGKPKWKTSTSTVSNESKFQIWWRPDNKDNGRINTNRVLLPDWTCEDALRGVFEFDAGSLYTSGFFPIDGRGFGNEGESHNYYFTMEFHTKGTYIANQELSFESSDDIFVYVNGHLVLDRGGYWGLYASGTAAAIADGHPSNVVNMDSVNTTFSLNLKEGDTYDLDIFWAQRSVPSSTLNIQSVFEMEPYFTLGDYHLKSTSPCIDAADNTIVPIDLVHDIEGRPRFIDDPQTDDTGNGIPPLVDMGSYEYNDPEDYIPIDVIVEDEKSRTLATDMVEVVINMNDAMFTGGYPDLARFKWTAITVPMGCSVDFDASTAEYIESSTSQLNPAINFIVDQQLLNVRQPVIFRLRLEGTDGFSEDAEMVNVVINQEGYNNPPAVTTGNPLTVAARQPLSLEQAEVTDDGLPSGMLITRWSVVSYPLDVVEAKCIFDTKLNENIVDAEVSFTQPGNYRLKLWATDLDKDAENYLDITVTGDKNGPPTVYAGDDSVVDGLITLTEPASLAWDFSTGSHPSTATDDNDSIADSVTCHWVAIGPSGGVTFDNMNIVQPTATFTKSGDYRLSLTATDDYGLSDTDYVTFIIRLLPEVEAGSPKARELTADTVDVEMSDAKVTFKNDSDTEKIEWIDITDPPIAGVSFIDNIVQPTITFQNTGTYTFQVTATDEAGSVSDTVTVDVYRTDPPVDPDLVTIYAAGSKLGDANYNGAQVYKRQFLIQGKDTVPIESQWTAISQPSDFDNADAVLSLCQFNKKVYAGTQGADGGNGDVYAYIGDNKWLPESDWSNVFDEEAGKAISYEGVVKCVYSLVVFNDCLFAGTNAQNKLFKYEGDGTWRAIKVSGQSSGIRCLYVWGDRLYLDPNKTSSLGYYDLTGWHPVP